MNQLNYEVLAESGYKGYILRSAPEKVMQFGEGNFLRAFVDYFFDIANEKVGYNGKVVLVQPIAQGLTDLINKQEGLYTLYLRGNEKGVKVDDKRVISSVSRCINPYGDWDKVLEFAKSDDLDIIVSNTTEAGIVHDTESTFDQCPPISFPAKLTRVLYERFTAGKPGIVMLSCELIDNNGKELLKCVNQYIDDWKLSDEFRAWVNSENIFCSTLVDRIVPGRIRDAEEVKRLSRLVTGMLNISKLEAGKMELNPVEFDISEMLFTTLLSFEQILERKNIDVRGLDSVTENKIRADKDMINQVIYNLTDNAVKFTPEGGYIEVASKSDAEKVIVKIRNSGKGIPEEEINQIFERFYKVDRSRSYDTKGAGMGLYIVKTLIELHGGEITARSQEGEYTEFIFSLPK